MEKKENSIIYNNLKKILTIDSTIEHNITGIKNYLLEILQIISSGYDMNHLLFYFKEAEKDFFTEEDRKRLLRKVSKEEIEMRKIEVITKELKRRILEDIKVEGIDYYSDKYKDGLQDLDSYVRAVIYGSMDFIFDIYGELGSIVIDLTEKELDFLTEKYNLYDFLNEKTLENNLITKKDIEDYLGMEIVDYLKLKKLEEEYKDKYETKKR